MKFLLNTIGAFAIIALSATFAAAAGFEGPGAHSTITKAVEAHHAPGETPCVLEGQLLEKVAHRKNHYVFADKTAQIVVEIKRSVFGDRTITPEDLLRISGSVEMDGRYPKELEVDSLEVIGKAPVPAPADKTAKSATK